MLKHTILLLLISAVCCQNKGGDLDALISEIFGNNPESTSNNQTNEANPSNNGVGSSSLAPSSESGATSGVSATQDLSCTTESGDVGTCVPYYLCDSNNTIVSDGAGIIDIRVRDGPCESYLDTCCLPPDTRQPDNPITPAPNTGDGEQPVQRQGCGWRNPNGVAMRIIGDVDNESKFGEFPWMVAILQRDVPDDNDPTTRINIYVGGGSLIHPSVVLTAAHAVKAIMDKIRVRAGEWDTQTKNEIYGYQDRDVTEVKIHEDFNGGTLFYDVGLLFLDNPMKITPNVDVVCLPPPRVKVPGGTRCLASGWGKDKFGKEGRYQVILKKVDIPVVERNACVQQLRKTRLGKYFELHSSFMCAGGEPGKDTCKGDGGSPLVCPIQDEDPDRYVQNGIVAWGIGCGADGTPGVYVDVANVREWIDNAVRGNGLEYTYDYQTAY